MTAMQCEACGKSVSVDENLGHGQPCPRCGGSVGRIPQVPVSTALSDLQEGLAPVRFGAYSKVAETNWKDPTESAPETSTAEASWDDPFEPRVEEQIERLVTNEAVIDNAVLNTVPPEIEARFKARQREQRKKLVGIGLAVAVVVLALIAFVMY